MADGTFGYFHGLGDFGAGLAAYVVGVVGNFILTPLAATASFSAPLAELGLNIGVEPRIVYFSFVYGFDNIIFPYETAPLLLFYGFGYIHFAKMVKVLAVLMTASSSRKGSKVSATSRWFINCFMEVICNAVI